MSIGVICDGCDVPGERSMLSGATAWVGNRGFRPAVADADLLARAGWVEAQGSHYCPDCVAQMVYDLGGPRRSWRSNP